ncbi:MAG: cobalamin-independent methionine synthase II family protein [Burkholderiales bacterium]
MKRSTDRILTTHVGSLPRPADLVPTLRVRERGQPYDAAALGTRVRAAVSDVVRRQTDIGVDIVDDGEMGKPGFIHYTNERLAGFEPLAEAVGSPWASSREVKAFPEFYHWFGRTYPSPAAGARHMVCTGPISYKGHGQLHTDIANMKAALAGRSASEVFMPSSSPTSVADWQRNRHYESPEAFLHAIAEAMREEYRAIVDAGFILQIDDPHILTHYVVNADKSIGQVREWIEVRIAALNHALRDIPRDRVRWHSCYGINIGPRLHDLELKEIVDLVLRIRAGAYSFEAANPRHEHEWRVWEGVKLPADTILIPGTITHSNVMVEHPEVVADRIERFAKIVGRENVIAGADCGFGTFAGSDEIHESVVWAKFEALVAGARIATKRLWGRDG